VSLDKSFQAQLDAEIARIERLLTEASVTQFERLLDQEGHAMTLTERERDMLRRAAKTSVQRTPVLSLLQLSLKSDDEIRSRLIDKLGNTCREVMRVTR